MFITPTLSISCITCMQGDRDHEEGSSKEQYSSRKKKSSLAPELYGGTTGGSPWDDGIYNGIREISLVYGQCIDSICVVYDKDGELVRGERHGGDDRGGDLNKPLHKAEIKLEYPDEFLVSVSGYYCGMTWIVGAPVGLRSLKFDSNRRTFGPFGVQVGTPFSVRVKDGDKIVGFKGRNGWYLDAIGFHLSHAPKRKLFRKSQGEEGGSDEHSYGKSDSSEPPELYGGTTGGSPWDDEIYDGIREITLVYGQCIDSMSVGYDKDGELILGERHGGDERGRDLHKPLNTAEIKLEYPDEFLVSVSGYYGGITWIFGAPVVLRSLKFESNRRTYGPFGVQIGTPFTFRLKAGDKIVGFKGRNGWYLDAIGFHISSVPKRELFRKVRKRFWKAYESLIKITKPLTSVECTCISL